MDAKKLCVDDTKLGPPLIPFRSGRLCKLVSCIFKYFVLSSTSYFQVLPVYLNCDAPLFSSFISIVRGDYRVLLQLN